MYSRKLGISEDADKTGNLEKFNEKLREQYSQKRNFPKVEVHEKEKKVEMPKYSENEGKSIGDFINNAKTELSNLNFRIDFENILILGIILIILTDTDAPDLVLLLILISLIF